MNSSEKLEADEKTSKAARKVEIELFVACTELALALINLEKFATTAWQDLHKNALGNMKLKIEIVVSMWRT